MSGLRNIAELMPGILRELRREPLAKRVDGGFDVYNRETGNVYEIDDCRMQSAADMAFWVRQLGEKTWVTKQHLIDLAQAVIDPRKP